MLGSSDPGPSGMDPSFTLYLMERSRLISSMYFCGLGVITWNFPDSFLFIVFISKCHCFRTLLINIKQGHKPPDVSKNIFWPKKYLLLGPTRSAPSQCGGGGGMGVYLFQGYTSTTSSAGIII